MPSRIFSSIVSPSIALGIAACADTKMTTAAPAPEARAAASATPAPTPASATAAAPKGPDDAAIAEAVRRELGARGAGALKVAVKSGEVTLSGDVESGQQLAQLATAVQKVAGVKAVIPDVNVKQ